MISTKFDEVQRNSIWREHLKKEGKEEFRSHEFSANLGVLSVITDKPTQLNPHELVKLADEIVKEGKTAKDLVGDMNVASAAGHEERQDDVLPASSGHAYGWRWEKGMAGRKRQGRWNVPREGCAETRYADTYASLFGKSAYSASAAR